MLLKFDRPILESVPERVQIMAEVCSKEPEGLVEQTLQSFHCQFQQVLLNLDLPMPMVSIVLELGLGVCSLELYRRRIMNQ